MYCIRPLLRIAQKSGAQSEQAREDGVMVAYSWPDASDQHPRQSLVITRGLPLPEPLCILIRSHII